MTVHSPGLIIWTFIDLTIYLSPGFSVFRDFWGAQKYTLISYGKVQLFKGPIYFSLEKNKDPSSISAGDAELIGTSAYCHISNANAPQELIHRCNS